MKQSKQESEYHCNSCNKVFTDPVYNVLDDISCPMCGSVDIHSTDDWQCNAGRNGSHRWRSDATGEH